MAINVIDPGRAILSGQNPAGATYRGSTGSGANFEIDTAPNNQITNAGITILDGGQDYRVGDLPEAAASFGGQLRIF